MTDQITGVENARPDNDGPKVQDLTDQLLEAFGRHLTRGCHGDGVGVGSRGLEAANDVTHTLI